MEDTLGGPFDHCLRCSLGQRRFRLRIHCYGETSWRDKAGVFPRSRPPPIVVTYPTVRVVLRLADQFQG